MKKHANKFFVLIFSVSCVAICVLLASLLSSAITVSGKELTSSTSFSAFNIYAISIGDYASEQSAKAAGEDVMKKGGAGYVLKQDNIYYVLASAYEKENDAKLVQENLTSGGISSKIIIIKISDANYGDVSSQNQKKSFNSALAELRNAYLKLYDISVSLDTKAIDETKAKIQIIEVKSSLEKTIEKLSKGSTSIDGIYYQMIKNTFNEIEITLEELKNYENINGINLSSKIKYVYINILDKIDSLIDLLNNKI